MSYGSLASVKGRAGRLATAWDATSVPGDAEIEQFLVEISDELDADLASLGLALPVSDAVSRALAGVVSDGALLMTLEGSWPGGTGGGEVQALRSSVEGRYTAARTAIREKTFPAVALALSEAGSGEEAGIRSLWETEPMYGTWQSREVNEQFTISESIAPRIRRTMRF